jgi:hypothetical protein
MLILVSGPTLAETNVCWTKGLFSASEMNYIEAKLCIKIAGFNKILYFIVDKWKTSDLWHAAVESEF